MIKLKPRIAIFVLIIFLQKNNIHAQYAVGIGSGFSVGCTLLNVPLPITLLSLTGNCVNGQIELNWATANETNNDYYTIEKSKDAINFEILGKVKGSGNSNTTKNYVLTDEYPFNSLTYYRLKQTDFNGNEEYTKIIAVNCKSNNIEVSVFPNPSYGYYTFLNTDYTSISIFDEIGRPIFSLDVDPYNEVNINLINIENGLYIAVFRNKFSDKVEYKKLIKN